MTLVRGSVVTKIAFFLLVLAMTVDTAIDLAADPRSWLDWVILMGCCFFWVRVAYLKYNSV